MDEFLSHFGDLRSVLSDTPVHCERLWETLEDIYELDRERFRDAVLPYLESTQASLPSPLSYPSSMEGLERAVAIVPFADFGLGCDEPGFDVRSLSTSPYASRLVRLSLSHGALLSSEVSVLANASELRRLQSLSLIANELTDEAAFALADAENLRNLRELHLRSNPMGDVGVQALAKSTSFPALERLRLGLCPVRDAGAIALAGSTTLEQLRYINLDCTRVTYAGAKAILESKTLPNLECLDVSYCGIGREEARALKSIRRSDVALKV